MTDHEGRSYYLCSLILFFTPCNLFDISFFHFIGTFGGELEEHAEHAEELHEMNKKNKYLN